ncbi:MAG: hypothetical protein DHS20C01_36770 [marine bacterium B5-7]|nr:MAG: hypothetical protein DHS20C01_36770 [marine bacterium B5-7]
MSDKIIEMRASDIDDIGFGRKIVDAFAQWNERRHAKRELSALPDHLLADIGIRREMIAEYVAGNVNRRFAISTEVASMARSVAPAQQVESNERNDHAKAA